VLNTSEKTLADEPDQTLAPLSLSDRVYRRIESLILSGKLKSGERLNDSRLAEMFSTSRGPVRNALARLAEVGLVDIIPYRGAFVRDLDLDDVLEIYEIRAALERAGVLAAARKMTPAALTRLSEIAERMHECVAQGDRETYFELNLTFHQLIHQTSGNRRLQELYERYTREQKLYRHFSLITLGIEESHHEHQAIMQALLDGDGERAAAGMEAHVLSARTRLEAAVRRSQAGRETEP